MNVLDNLANQLGNQFGIGESNDDSLDAIVDGKTVKYGALSALSGKIDQSAQRKYLEEGFLRNDPYNVSPKMFEVLMQQPSATVFIKKRMFSSLAENYRPDYMDKDDALFYKASKVLFKNKCDQISALEKLSKIEKITQAMGEIPDAITSIILGISDGLQETSLAAKAEEQPTSSISKFFNATNKIKKLFAYNNTNYNTTWVMDKLNPFKNRFGDGTGVIELTNFTSINCGCGIDLNPNNCSVDIDDPYQCMLITEYDIERAIADSTNIFYNHKIFQFGLEGSSEVINNTKNSLNALRANRGVSTITIKVNPNALYGKKVIAIMDRIGAEIKFEAASNLGSAFGLGETIQIDPAFIKDNKKIEESSYITGLVNKNEGLDDKEQQLFKLLISSIYNQLMMSENSVAAITTNNKNTNYVRRKMRFHFLGKLIVQPMDVIHVYFNSKSQYDNKVLGGDFKLFTGLDFFQQANNAVSNFKNLAAIFDPQLSMNFQVEKNLYVGPDFPNVLWALLRNNFVTEKQGTHVFAGIVQSANSSWSGGQFKTSIQAHDNAAYFDLGQVNFKPGSDVWNGSFFDPLTPFKSKFDEISSNTDRSATYAPELLPENKILLGKDKESSLLKARTGRDSGKTVTEKNYISDAIFDDKRGSFNKVFHAPDGLVYKWKEGIGTFIQYGNTTNINESYKVGIQNQYTDPFAGQDVMNVISLCVTGLPYNYYTYWKASTGYNSFAKNKTTLEDSSSVYSESIKSSLTKSNMIWGNFIPFKSLSVSKNTLDTSIANQIALNSATSELEKLLQDYEKEYNNALHYNYAGVILSETGGKKPDTSDNKFYYTSQVLGDNINKQIQEFKNAAKELNISVAGTDVTVDTNSLFEKNSRTDVNDNLQTTLRKRVNFLTRRMSYDVRANEDKNLFIVEDHYDNDYDILAYEKAFETNLPLYNNKFDTVRDKIDKARTALNLEVFCDTQGHIRARPPQYNRMPSSVFYKMMNMKRTLGIQLFPEFLNKLFTDQINSVKEKIEILEAKIKLDCAFLGNNTDEEALSFINSYGSASNGTNGQNVFKFLTDINCFINPKDENNKSVDLVEQASLEEGKQTNDFKNLSKNIENQSNNLKSVYTTADRASYITNILSVQAQLKSTPLFNPGTLNDNDRIKQLIQIIEGRGHERVVAKDYVYSASGVSTGNYATPLDIFKIAKELSDNIAQRQKLVKLFYKLIKSSSEFRALDDPNSNISNKLIAPELYGNKEIPEFLDHLIEDESYDDLGPGSGSRYVIKDSQITSLRISEHKPQMCAIEVHGTLSQEISVPVNTLPQSFTGGGNALTSALAIDYDLWRAYGYSSPSVIPVPFLTDPSKQLAPYASLLLSRNRKNILMGSVTISGNEYMQPGEVVYIESRNLLFYVRSISHNYTEGYNFTTTLDLIYGHSPGDYIPNVFDMIGKLFYNNKDSGEYIIERNPGGDNQYNLGVICNDGSSDNVNKDTIYNILYTAAAFVKTNTTTNVNATIELRTYFDKITPKNQQITSSAEQLKKILTNGNPGADPNAPLKEVTKSMMAENKTLFIDEKSVIIRPIDLSDNLTTVSPSQKAMFFARNKTNLSDNFAPASQDKLRSALINNVIDCWIVVNRQDLKDTDTNVDNVSSKTTNTPRGS